MLVWKGFDEQTAAFFVALMFFTMIPLRLGLGLAANAIPPRLVVLGGTSLGALGLAAMLAFEGAPAVAGFVMGFALLEGLVTVNWITVGHYFGRSHFASLIGMMSAFNSGAAVVSPIFAAWLFDQTQSYRWVLLSSIPILITGGILLPWRPNPTCPSRQLSPHFPGDPLHVIIPTYEEVV